jgi:hypothetical protein
MKSKKFLAGGWKIKIIIDGGGKHLWNVGHYTVWNEIGL